MIQDLEKNIEVLMHRVDELGRHLDIAGKEAMAAGLRAESVKPGLWDDPERAQRVMQELSRLEAQIAPWQDVHRRLQDAAEMMALLHEEEDPSPYVEDLEREIAGLQRVVEQLAMADLLGGEHDPCSAFLEINAGAGGTESCDWVTMLLRMYLRWAERHGFTTEILDQTEGEVTGLKSVTVRVRGNYAYGYLRAERGVHRLVRISPFDANRRRHTSFASVDVLPETEAAEEVRINPDELRIETFRSSGAGGQNVQKNETAVRITHLPTGTVVQCQNERSQLRNRDFALAVLQARLAELRRKEQEAKMAEMRGEVRAIEWGNQIRSYVFQPYTLVKDHRTGIETGNIIAVMDGEIDDFIRAYLVQFRASTS
ncbi:MAG: peptide chain release factor 2 [Armatimonadetes bacterium]|nr:peptide chain release factor 2 [Armatimonadota bacterium]